MAFNEIAPPPQAANITGAGGLTDPAWFQWFQEVWDKSRSGFQSLISTTIGTDEDLEFIITDKFSDFKDFKIVFNNVLVSNPGAFIYLQISQDSGSSYKKGSTDYSWILSNSAANSFKSFDNNDSQMQLVSPGLGNNSTNIVTGEIIFYNLSGESDIKFFKWDLRYKDTNSQIVLVRGAGSYNSSGTINGIKFFPSTGTFSSGELEIFGSK